MLINYTVIQNFDSSGFKANEYTDSSHFVKRLNQSATRFVYFIDNSNLVESGAKS